MAVSRKREESDLKIDALIDDRLRQEDMQVDTRDHEALEALSDRLEERLNREDAQSPSQTTDAPKEDGGEPPVDGADDEPSHAGPPADAPKTIDDILDKVDADAKSKVGQAVDLDQRRLTTAVNPIIKAKAEQSRKASARGWVPFCFALMVLGLVWMTVGFCTAGKWPLPFLGGWNMACGGFLLVYGGLMLLGTR